MIQRWSKSPQWRDRHRGKNTPPFTFVVAFPSLASAHPSELPSKLFLTHQSYYTFPLPLIPSPASLLISSPHATSDSPGFPSPAVTFRLPPWISPLLCLAVIWKLPGSLSFTVGGNPGVVSCLSSFARGEWRREAERGGGTKEPGERRRGEASWVRQGVKVLRVAQRAARRQDREGHAKEYMEGRGAI